MFELQLEEVELEAAINSWNEELYKHSSINETDNPLSLLMDRIKQIHQKTVVCFFNKTFSDYNF